MEISKELIIENYDFAEMKARAEVSVVKYEDGSNWIKVIVGNYRADQNDPRRISIITDLCAERFEACDFGYSIVDVKNMKEDVYTKATHDQTIYNFPIKIIK